MTEATPVHWDDEIIGFDMHPSRVSGVGAVKTISGFNADRVRVKFVEVWDGSADASEPIGSAGIRPDIVESEAFMPHARWVLEFTPFSTRLQAMPIAAPAPWGED